MTTTAPPLIIPVFIPHLGCPHQCAFCNQSVIAGQREKLPDRQEIVEQVDGYLRYRGNRPHVELAFFGGNFLGLNQEDRYRLLDAAQSLVEQKKIDFIRFSTRPDTITPETLTSLSGYAVKTVEIGVQSMNDDVLLLSRRGHTSSDTRTAAERLRETGFETGMQMMVGLPGDDDESALETGRAIAALTPAFVRIYPLLVLKGSAIYRWYIQGRYQPMQLDHCVTLVKRLYSLFSSEGIRVIRMGLQTSDLLQGFDGIAAGPWHPAFGHLVYSELFLDKTLAMLAQAMPAPVPGLLTIHIHPASESRLRGDRNRNMDILASCYPGITFSIRTDPGLGPESICVEYFPDQK
ncbi:MAG: radical SAM protein [Pseudomonadota bacterium]